MRDIAKSDEEVILHVRVNAALAARVDEYIAKHNRRAPSTPIGKSQAIRSLIALGCAKAGVK